MPTAGRNSKILVNGYDLSGYLKKFVITGNADVADTTVFGLQDKTFLPTLRHATLTSEGFFDAPSTFKSDAVFSAAIGSTAVWTFYEYSTTLGAPGVGVLTDETKYEVQSPVESVVSLTVDGQVTGTRDRITSLHQYVSVAAGGSTTAFTTAVSINGAVGYIQASSFTGTLKLTAFIEHSSGGAFSTLIPFNTSQSAPFAQKVTISSTNVKQTVRATWTVTGAGTAKFNIGFKRL